MGIMRQIAAVTLNLSLRCPDAFIKLTDTYPLLNAPYETPVNFLLQELLYESSLEVC